MRNTNIIFNRCRRTNFNTCKSFGTGTKSEEELIKIIKEKFDLTPRGIIEYLNLKNPIYTKTTNYGHFGKKELPWEKIIEI